ncbi:bifunctional NAD(P)H-hydrate repair enzyme Nnr [bacterium BMS3Abin02]|nr:bifunctional NAD(P)H-hydrate repair enzyme Nnr [bacterium BMS3Abin02]GBE21634.1 bifunctional NAD(P)H-hydrate repair enzyme Nnr [bacterium BMS3Bbin01]HDH25907.1 NAD(P)H-hydrate epimerase [Actinomycetota bacterium]
MFPRVDLQTVPALTEEQMREVDRVMIEDLGIVLVQMMENAGRNLAELAIRRFRPSTVTVLAGTGGNGGGGLVAARHLANRGRNVSVVIATAPDRLGRVPRAQLEILQQMGVRFEADPRDADLVIDALIGYSLRGDPRGRTAELIRWAKGRPVLSLDTPSGLNVTSGEAGDPCIDAIATMTLALPKVGLLDASQVGELYLADISVPPSVYTTMGLESPPLFAEGTVVRLD